jgi:hypothetical protein
VIDSSVQFLWRDREVVRHFSTGVCLHGHTMHSEECLSFLPSHLKRVPGISRIVKHYQHGRPRVDFARAFWTPPLSPASALQVEREQIAGLDLRAIVSLTDHDNIEAGRALQIAADPRRVPVSVEWTVPYERSIFHIGVHNLPPMAAPAWLARMAEYTAAPDESVLPEILRAIAGMAEVLVVLNHPFWLEEGVEESAHPPALHRLLRECNAWFHAFELNGTRPWSENSATIALAQTHSRPVISGGDRHACEPAACINLTDARSFSEFADEVKAGHSSVMFMPHYRQPMALRILEASSDILRQFPEYPSRERWMDRFFYRDEDGKAQSLAALWEGREPWILRPATALLQSFAGTGIRGALRFLLSRQAQAQP